MRLVPALVVLAALPVARLSAQDVPTPAPVWTGSLGAGISTTSGNTNTSNWNFSFKARRDPQTKTVLLAEGMLIRGSKDGELNADNSLLNTRVERRVNGKGYLFAHLTYLRDSFKSIDYFLAPTLGLGYPFYKTDAGSFAVDLSAGASFEKNPDLGVKSHSVVAFGEKFSRALSKTATLTQAFTGNVVANDLANGLYTASVGVAASVTNRTQIKVEVLDTYRTTPPTALIDKSDLSTVLSLVYKF